MAYLLQGVGSEKWRTLKRKLENDNQTLKSFFVAAIDAYLSGDIDNIYIPPVPTVLGDWQPVEHKPEGEKVQLVAFVRKSVKDYLHRQPGSYGDVVTRLVLRGMPYSVATPAPPFQAPPTPTLPPPVLDPRNAEDDELPDCQQYRTKECPGLPVTCPTARAGDTFCPLHLRAADTRKPPCSLLDSPLCPGTGEACAFLDKVNYFCKYC